MTMRKKTLSVNRNDKGRKCRRKEDGECNRLKNNYFSSRNPWWLYAGIFGKKNN
jgi:hypothetical protein